MTSSPHLDTFTPEQEARLGEYYEQFLAIGYDTSPADHAAAERAVDACYALEGLPPPRKVWAASPDACWPEHLLKNPPARFYARLSDRLYVRFCTHFYDHFSDHLRTYFYGRPLNNLFYRLHTHLFARPSLRFFPHLSDHLSARPDSTWFHYAFGRDVLGIDPPGLTPVLDLARNCGWSWAFDGLCLLSEPFVELHVLPDTGDLHYETGMAVRYADNWGLWALHGVVVPETVVTTRPEAMTRDWLQKHYQPERNAEVRREIGRKLGIDLLIHRLGARSIQKWDGSRPWEHYELLEFEMQPGEMARYLKMVNPSLSLPGEPPVCHIERVGGECGTIEQALRWREPDALRSKPRGRNGAPWQQQGDVCIWPADAKVLQPWPEIVT